MKKLAHYLKPYWFFALMTPVTMIIEVLVDLFQPKLMSKIVDEGVLGGDMRLIIITGISMLGLAVLGGLGGIGSAAFASYASQNFGCDLRCDVFSRVTGFAFEQNDKFTTGSLITRLTNDITAVQDFVAVVLRMFVRSSMLFCGGIVMMLTLNVKFGLVIACSLPVQILIIIFILVKAAPMYSQVQKKLDSVNSVMQENVTGARVVKAYVREDYEEERFGKANDGLMQTNLKVLKLMAIVNPLVMIVMNISVVAIIYMGGLQVEASAMNVGDVMAAITYITTILMSIMMVSMMFQSVSRAKASADRIVEVLETFPVIVDGNYTSDDCKGEISFKNVSFSYPSSSGKPVISNFSLDIHSGENIAILGATGSGKTSLISLIPRFYDVTDGEVLLDGVNVKEYSLHDLRSRVGVVLQKSELFSGTIADNIRWGKEYATDEEVVNAGKIAQADEFISSIQDGYNSIIGEKGSSLSGGQKQRLSIARAIVKQPSVLIFDDSTSALDLGTEKRLKTALRENLQGTTVITIAQRIASVMTADKIAVLENGTLSAYGTHDELLKTSEVYRDIYNSQMRNNEKGGEENV